MKHLLLKFDNYVYGDFYIPSIVVANPSFMRSKVKPLIAGKLHIDVETLKILVLTRQPLINKRSFYNEVNLNPELEKLK